MPNFFFKWDMGYIRVELVTRIDVFDDGDGVISDVGH